MANINIIRQQKRNALVEKIEKYYIELWARGYRSEFILERLVEISPFNSRSIIYQYLSIKDLQEMGSALQKELKHKQSGAVFISEPEISDYFFGNGYSTNPNIIKSEQ